MLSLIACIGKNRELGYQGRLVFEIPEDMRYFREITEGHKVLMGRKTWESLPGKLPGRTNIVVSRGGAPKVDSAKNREAPDEMTSNLADFLEANKDIEEEIFVIGGGEIYRMALLYAGRLYLTEVDAVAPEADTWFPEFDPADYNREIIGGSREGEVKYQFVKYTKKEAK